MTENIASFPFTCLQTPEMPRKWLKEHTQIPDHILSLPKHPFSHSHLYQHLSTSPIHLFSLSPSFKLTMTHNPTPSLSDPITHPSEWPPPQSQHRWVAPVWPWTGTRRWSQDAAAWWTDPLHVGVCGTSRGWCARPGAQTLPVWSSVCCTWFTLSWQRNPALQPPISFPICSIDQSHAIKVEYWVLSINKWLYPSFILVCVCLCLQSLPWCKDGSRSPAAPCQHAPSAAPGWCVRPRRWRSWSCCCGRWTASSWPCTSQSQTPRRWWWWTTQRCWWPGWSVGEVVVLVWVSVLNLLKSSYLVAIWTVSSKNP